MRPELARIGNLEIGIDRTQPLRIDLDRDVVSRAVRDQRIEHLSDRAGVAAPDVVVLTPDRVLCDEQVIRAHRVPHVGERPQGVQVADLHHRWNQVRLDHRDLLGERRLCEDVAATRARMREHPRRHHLHPVRLGIEPPEKVGADLRNRVRRGGMERRLLSDRHQLLRNAAEDLRGSAHVDDRIQVRAMADRLQDVGRALDIRLQRIERRRKRRLRVTLCREVEDVVRPRRLHRALNRHVIPQVPIHEPKPVPTVHAVDMLLDVVERAAPTRQADELPIVLLQQEVGEVGADHAGDAGDEGCGQHSSRPFPCS